MKNCAFTICAKNYLAQAFSLKESFLKYNNNFEFYIFLSDLKGSNLVPDDVFELDEKWIPDWKVMAFKYNVIEFSTSIKPFCFNKLFIAGYDKIVYLDPDIYVTSSLLPIYKMLDNKSIVMTPHYCNIQNEYTGSVSEEKLLFVGIYNLGFVAIKNDEFGNKIIQWWCRRLKNKCYADAYDSLHVDQRWMDFVPAFFPDNVLITHHLGINSAIWNLHERYLDAEDGTYIVVNSETKERFPLLFFHFSGFDPFNPEVLNRRHPKYNLEMYPSFRPLVKEYIEAEYRNGYETYSKLPYSLNSFSDGSLIFPIYRRLYRAIEQELPVEDPFDSHSAFVKTLKKNGLFYNRKIQSIYPVNHDARLQKKRVYTKALLHLFSILRKCIGIDYYSSLLFFLYDFSRFESQKFMIKHIVK